MDLRHSLIPDDLIEDLLHSMPSHTGPDMESDRQLPKYDYISFMERMIGNKKEEANGAKHMG
jgi:Ca2+ insensitive EF hand